ncbi:hypothetical protein CHS0354_014665 [Potamilus streckersoni]|uniref:SOCS box domain-containing protein n=1 Tax=Potamilus streckersoni TaxID=2493646 RepID=A0AAE0VYY1_9BIVA|nr:hypothetical protein CHS0354_014665 [Potamilus streckersoni]
MANVREKKSCDIVLKEIEEEKKLVEAAKSGNLEDVKRLLEAGVSPDATEYNRSLFYKSQNYVTPLQYASVNGYTDLVRLLLQYKAVPHPGGTTPLHLAASSDHVACVTHLIWNGADYNAVDEKGRTSLYIAAQKGFERCIHAHLNNAIWRDILSLPVNETGDTPLHESVKNNMFSCVSALLRHGSDVNHRNAQGFSPLHLALRAGERFSMEILKELVTKGYNTDVNKSDGLGYTPLHYVCFHENIMQERRPEAAALLLAYGANWEVKNKQGDNVLQNELRSRTTDVIILHTIAKCTAHLPSLASIGLGFFDANPTLNVANYHFPRIFSDGQNAKMRWYKDLFKEPRTLQHYCRCVIRNALGKQRFRKIDILPLPTTLKEYLLLEHEEFR